MVDFINVSDTTPRVAYTAAPGQTGFAIPFVFFDEADLRVYVDDVLQVLSTDYITSGAEDEDGGTVTFSDALVGGESVVISRNLALELETHIPTSGQLDIAAINRQFSLFMALMHK